MNTFAVPPRRDALSAHEIRRYSRHLLLEGFGDQGQKSLLASRIAVVGAGGLGAPVLQYLAAAGVSEITVIDPDFVDSSNLQRQVIHSESSVGTRKVASAARAVHALNPATVVREHFGALTPSNALEILAGHHLVIDGSDNFPTRYLVSDACEILNLPLVWGSILEFSGQLSVFFGDGGRGVTYRDLHPEPPAPGDIPSCSDAGVIGALVGVVGTSMAMEAIKVLTGVGEPLLGRVKIYDALSGDWSTIEVERDPNREQVTQVEDLVDTCGYPALTGVEAHAQPDRQGTAPAPLPDLGAFAAGLASRAEPAVVSPSEAIDAARAGTHLIDIRSDELAAAGMLERAVHIEEESLLAWARGEAESPEGFSSPSDLDGAILYCQGGMRTHRVQGDLAALGISVIEMAGGYKAALATQALSERASQ